MVNHMDLRARLARAAETVLNAAMFILLVPALLLVLVVYAYYCSRGDGLCD